jgi:type IV pilus assembly protein PilE
MGNKNIQGDRGFTLVELMITVAIVAILSSLAYSAYTGQVRKTSRKEAVGKVLDIARRLEGFRSQYFRYPLTSEAGQFSLATNKYSYVVNEVGGGQGYEVVAQPSAATSQAGDICGTMTYRYPGSWVFSTGLLETDCL